MICQKISTLHVYWFARKISPCTSILSCTFNVFQNFPTCTFISYCTSIRYTRVAENLWRTFWHSFLKILTIARFRIGVPVTLVYRIDVQYKGGNFFSKSINVQTKIRPCRWKFFLKINKRADQNRTAVQDEIDVQGGKFS